jgi:hypothetical protein
MQHDKHGKTVQYGREIDHINPITKGGPDELSNLQPLQRENSRHKGGNWPSSLSDCKVKICPSNGFGGDFVAFGTE